MTDRSTLLAVEAGEADKQIGESSVGMLRKKAWGLQKIAWIGSAVLVGTVVCALVFEWSSAATWPVPRSVTQPQADGGSTFSGTVVGVLGYVAPLISLWVYTPQAVRLWNRKSAEGLAESTWVIKLFAITSTALFTLHLGLPISAAADVILLMLQAAVVIAFVLAFGSERQRVTILPALLVYSIWIAAFAQGIIPEVVYSALQSLAAVSLTFALMPQIALNCNKGEAGNFSPLTSSLGLLLCSIHVVTILSVPAWSPILLATWAGAAVANCVLTAQIIYYNSRAGIDVYETFSSDLRPQPK